MDNPLDIIKRGLGGAATTLGLPGLGTIASEQMQRGVQERKKTPLPSAFGDQTASSVLIG